MKQAICHLEGPQAPRDPIAGKAMRFLARLWRARNDRGFTLLELIVTIALVGAMVLSLGLLFNANFKVFYNQTGRSDIKGKAGRALETWSNELRQAASLTAATVSSVTITLDTDADGDDDTIQYTWGGASGNPFNRISGGVTTPIINSVSSAAFSCYDSTGALLSFPVTLSQVKSIAVTVTATSDRETFTLRSQTTLRNL